MKNTNDTEKILSAIDGLLEDRMKPIASALDGLGDRMDRLEGRMDGIGGRIGGLEGHMDGLDRKMGRLESRQEETIEALQSLASHMDKRFDETNHQMMNLFRTADRKVDNLINALAKKKILTRPEANTLMAAGPVV